MKYLLIVVCSLGFFSPVIAQQISEVDVTIDSMSNADRLMEVCGTATSLKGNKSLGVTIVHADRKYSTLVSPDGKWCAVIKRWSFSGTVEAEGFFLGH